MGGYDARHVPSSWGKMETMNHQPDQTGPARPGSPEPRYRMPAEWSNHAATWIAWPHNAEDWPGKFQPIPWVYSEIVRHLSRVEDVHILVNNTDSERRATNLLRRAGANLARLHFHHWQTDRLSL